MRVGIQTWGSDGDVRPMIALAAGVRRAGHDVRLIASSVDDTDYAPLAERLGVPLDMVPPRMNASIGDMAKRAGGGANPIKLMRVILGDTFFPHLDAMHAAALELCATSDVVVGHFAAWHVKAAALETGAPFAAAVLWPGLVPTRDEPPLWMPRLAALNRFEWWLAITLADVIWKKPAAELYARRGLPAIRHSIPDVLISHQLNLLGASPALWPQASDWGDTHPVCGAFTIPDEAEPTALPGDFDEFMSEREPPVFLSLGSPEQADPVRSRALLVEAARLSRVRAVIQLKSDRLETGRREGDLYFLPRTSHAALFQRCSFVVHHGGAGTAHTVARAGVPSIAVHFSDEQWSWGDRLYRAGVAMPPLNFFRATPAKLAARIRDALATPSLATSATSLAERMRSEDGCAEAVRHLEALVGRR